MGKGIKAGVATLLSVGVLAGAIFIPLPSDSYEVLNSQEVPSSVSHLINVVGLESLDPHGDRFYITSEEAREGEYYEANRMQIDNNTIRISLDENLSEKYVRSATEAVQLYQKLFDIINPNIKVEVGFFGKENNNIYIRESDNDCGNMLMSASMLKWGSEGSLARVNSPSTINVYNLSDELSAKENSFSFAHEFAHSIFGMDDYSKLWVYEKYGNGPTRPKTIMNYNDIQNFRKVSKTPKFTTLDVAQAIAQWGLFSNNGVVGENPFSSEEEYLAYVDSRLHEICYSKEELILSSDVETTVDGAISLFDYIGLMRENKNMFENELTAIEDDVSDSTERDMS